MKSVETKFLAHLLQNNSTKLALFIIGLTFLVLSLGSCSGNNIPTTVEENPESIIATHQTSAAQVIPTQTFTLKPSETLGYTSDHVDNADVQFGIYEPEDQIDPSFVNFQLNYFTGGAGSCGNYGQEQICELVESGPISLYISGVYSVADQEDKFSEFCINDRFTSCKAYPEIGDMIYFIAEGYQLGEEIDIELTGPLGERHYSSKVSRELLLNPSCGLDKIYEAARFSWVASPELGIGEYSVTTMGLSGSATIRFAVENNTRSNFGASFGSTGDPLLLERGERIKLVYAGFPTGHTITTLLFKDPISITDEFFPSQGEGNSLLLGHFEAIADEHGYAIHELPLSNSLSSGIYSIVVPEIIPQSSDCPLAYSIQFRYQGETGSESGIFRICGFVSIDNTDPLSVLSGPGIQYDPIGAIPNDATNIQIIDIHSDSNELKWASIRFNDIGGWIDSNYLCPGQ